MTSSAVLAQFIGTYLLIVSVIFMVRHDAFDDYAETFVTNHTMRLNMGFMELAAGLAILFSHNVWRFGYEGVVTLLGCLMVAESIFHLGADEEHERRLIDGVTDDLSWPVIAGATLLVGLFLVTKGFSGM